MRYSRTFLTGLFLSALLLFLISGEAPAQSITIVLSQPPPNQLRVSDLWRVQLFNNSRESVEVYLQGIATRIGEGQIVDAESKAFSLPPGRLAVKGSQLEPIKVNQSNPKYRDIVTRTGTVPSGEYEICVFVRNAATGEELGSDCITQIVEHLSPPILIAPTDESDVQEPLPLFTWTPPVPAPNSGRVSYTLRIAEILGRQTPYDALQSNPAFYEKTSIPTTTFQYPTAARAMQTDKRYAWRVTAYSNGVSLGESEVWQFTKKPQMMILSNQNITTATIALLTFKADRLVGGKGQSAALIKNKNSGGGGKAIGSFAAGPGSATLDAQAWTWGNNEYGQLGTGGTPTTARPTPKAIESLNHVREMALGGEHGLAIELSGNVAAWGNNDFGQLGLGNDESQNTPKWIPSFVGAIDVAAGNYHSVAVKNDGTVWTWGYNRSGELGLGNKADKDKPTKVSITNVAAVAAGDGHTLALKSDGTVWGWGTNRNGQVDPTFGADPAILSPKKVEGLSNVKAIAAGSNFSLALLEDGTVKAWGANNSGQLGNGDADPDAKQVEKFIKGFKYGGGTTGGTPIGKFKAADVEKRGFTATGVSKNMELGYVLTNLNGIVTVSTLNNVMAIDAGGAHGIALRKDSTVWTWGNNFWGTLGTGGREFHTGPTRVTGLNSVVSIAAGSDNSFAVQANGTVNAWGNNFHKQLGMNAVPASAGSEGEDFATSPVVVPKP